jgi:hypothetical protein
MPFVRNCGCRNGFTLLANFTLFICEEQIWSGFFHVLPHCLKLKSTMFINSILLLAIMIFLSLLVSEITKWQN